MDELKSATEIKKISEENLKIHEENNRKVQDIEDLQAYNFCVRAIESAAFCGKTNAECHPLAEKYEKLLKQKGYKLKMEKDRPFGDFGRSKMDVLHASWKDSSSHNSNNNH